MVVFSVLQRDQSVPCRLGKARRTELYARPPVEFLGPVGNTKLQNPAYRQQRGQREAQKLVMAKISGGCPKPRHFMKKAF